MWKSLLTTVVTPRKCPGREAPSRRSPSPSTSTQVEAPAGYISSTVGAKIRSTPSASRRAQSVSNVRGYLARSSLGPNWVGFTKIETVVMSHVAFDAFTSERCPAWSAPIVGTRPSDLPSWRRTRQADCISLAFEMICTWRESAILANNGETAVAKFIESETLFFGEVVAFRVGRKGALRHIVAIAFDGHAKERSRIAVLAHEFG